MRNADVHGHDQTTRQEQREQNNIKRLQTLYDQQQNMEPRVREELLYDTIEEHIQQSRHTLQNWLAVHELTILQSIKQAAKRAIQGVRLIKSYSHLGGHQMPLR
jgi:exopolysaccharide biosynthesis predicted pyruvyltransferase EpsI